MELITALITVLVCLTIFTFVFWMNRKSNELDEIVEAADRGNREAQRTIMEQYHHITPNDLAKIRKRIYLPKAEEGDNFAQYQMGWYYWLFENNPMQAEKWFIESANGGNVQAMKHLADGYSEGYNDSGITTAPMGFGMDQQKEQKWLLQAASLGDEEAMCTVGKKYYCLKNYEVAENWLYRALKSKDCKIRMETFEYLGKIYGDMAIQEFYDEKKSKAMFLEAIQQRNLTGIETGTYDKDIFSDIASYLGEKYAGEYCRTHNNKALKNAVYCYAMSYYTGNEVAEKCIQNLPYQITESDKALWKFDITSQNFRLPFSE